MEFIQEIIDHEGLPASIHVTSSRYEGVTLTVRGSKEELLGQVQLKPILNGYQLCLQKGAIRQLVPFIDQSEEGELLQEILPAYRGLVSGRTFGILVRPEIREMPVSEFLTLLRKAVEHDAIRLGMSWRGSRWDDSLYGMSSGIGPKTVRELAQVFLGENDG